MASESNCVYGFELMNRAFGSQICKKEDVLVLFTHWFLTKMGFKCIGLGDSKSYDATDTGSELLPDGWNQRPNYALRYLREGKLYILLAVTSDADFLMNFMKIKDNNVSNIQLPIESTVKDLSGSLEKLIPDYQAVLHKIRTELVEPVYSGSSKNNASQTEPQRFHNPENVPLRVNPPFAPGLPMGIPPSADPRRIGDDDLNPLGGIGGGGMIFDPFRGGPMQPGGAGFFGIPGRLPPGGVPPGARFDPMGPFRPGPIPRMPQNPDNDHMPFPGHDHMFM